MLVRLFGQTQSINVLIAFGFAIVLVYLVGALIVSSRLKGKFLVRLGASALFIFAVNILGGLWGFAIPLNPITVLIPAVAGIPGFLLVLALQFIL